MLFKPFYDQIYGIVLFFSRQLSTFRNIMPFFKASTATATCSMLCNERWKNTMSHRSLSAIIWYVGRCKTLRYYFCCTFANCLPIPFLNIFLVLAVKIETTSKLRLRESVENMVEIRCGFSFLFFLIIYWK